MARAFDGSTDALLADAVERAARTVEELARQDELDSVNEARHLQLAMKDATHEVAAAAPRGPRVKTQWPAAAVCWPKLGPVDIVLLSNDSKPIWVELKCGVGADALGPCAWDGVKCAWGVARRYAGGAYLVAATTAHNWSRARGTGFFAAGDWSMLELRHVFRDWWRHWEKDGYPVANRLPERFATQPISTASFLVGGSAWELRLARVSVPEGLAWIEWPPLLGGDAV